MGAGNVPIKSLLKRRGFFLAAVIGILPLSGAGSAESVVEEIIVTAQRRAEESQSVPISISAVTARAAKLRGVESLLDISAIAPSVTFTTTIGGAQVAIRGIGSTGSAGDESANALYIDGVYQSALPALVFDLNNISRIEVLKGPQGTLFGRNASGGVIQIITRDPSAEPHADVSVSYSSYNTSAMSLYGTSGIADRLAADIAAIWTDQQDGWGTNVFNGHKAFAGDSFGARSKWHYDLSDQSDLVVAVAVNHARDPSMQGWSIIPGQITKAHTPSVGFYNVNLNHDTTFDVEQRNFSVTYKNDFEFAKIVNIVSYDSTDLKQQFDQDASPANIVYGYIKRGSDTWTEEIQLVSPDAATVKWIGGFFYLHNNQTLKPLQTAGAAIAPLTFSTIYANMPEDSYAGYGQATITAFDKTHLTAGLRYTTDNRTLQAITTTSANPSGITYLAQHSDSKLTWRMALDREFAPDLLGYASVSRGFKSGLFNITAPANPAVLPQTVDAYEIGIKSDAFDHKLRFNAAGFYNVFDNIQVRQNIPGGFLLLNAPTARTKGIDMDLSIAPVQDWPISTPLTAASRMRHFSRPSLPAGRYRRQGMPPVATRS